MKHDYRGEARKLAVRARATLEAAADIAGLRYAALEARMVIEALTFDRAQAYRDELPSDQIGTWQPNQVLSALLALDPYADQGRTIRVGKQPAKGVPAAEEDMRLLGTEVVFGLKAVKAHYNALGSLLHMPTMKQWEDGSGARDVAKTRARIAGVLNDLDRVLASTIFNAKSPRPTTYLPCVRCGVTVRKVVLEGLDTFRAKCPACDADYEVERDSDGTFMWVPYKPEVECPAAGCKEILTFWDDEAVTGATQACPRCHSVVELSLCASVAAAAPGPSVR